MTRGSEVITFIYNPFGQRVMKTVTPTSGDPINTYYGYDANGQVMAVYTVVMEGATNTATLSEQHIYGASRLGMIKQDLLIYDEGATLPPFSDDDVIKTNTIGLRNYEVTNHLGNVNAVITDRKMWNNTDGLYEAVVTMTADYYPGGFLMPGRNTNSGDYRYAYNGMETDNEVSGNGNSYTTEFRQYDPRLMRWKSLDPLKSKYPSTSPYVAFNNNPIYFIDPSGLSSVNGKGDDVGEGKSKRQKMYLWKRLTNKNVREAFRDQKKLGGRVDVWKKDGKVYASRSGSTGYDKGSTVGSDGVEEFGAVNVKAQIYRPEKAKSFFTPLAGPNSSTSGPALSSKVFQVLFKDGGTAEALLTHYGKGGGKAFYLSDKQIKEVFPNYTDGTGTRSFNLNPNGLGVLGSIETGNLSVYASSDGTLGQFTISMSGESRLEDVTSVSLTQKVTSTQVVFRGVVTLYDHFDFDVRGPGEDPRHGSAGFQTWVGRNFISGQGFHVYGTIEVMQVGNGPLTDMNGVPLHNQGYTRKQD